MIVARSVIVAALVVLVTIMSLMTRLFILSMDALGEEWRGNFNSLPPGRKSYQPASAPDPFGTGTC